MSGTPKVGVEAITGTVCARLREVGGQWQRSPLRNSSLFFRLQTATIEPVIWKEMKRFLMPLEKNKKNLNIKGFCCDDALFSYVSPPLKSGIV